MRNRPSVKQICD